MGLHLEAWPAEVTDQFIEIVKSIERHHGFGSGGEPSLRLHLADLVPILGVPIQAELHTLFVDYVLRRADIKLEPDPEQAPRMAEQHPTATTTSTGADEPTTGLTTRDNPRPVVGRRDELTPAEVITELRSWLDDRLRVLGADHPDSLRIRGLLAWWLCHDKQIDAGISEYRRLLAAQLRVLGADHRDTLNTRHNLGYWLASQDS